MENYQPAIMGAPVATCLKHSLQLTVRISQKRNKPQFLFLFLKKNK